MLTGCTAPYLPFPKVLSTSENHIENPLPLEAEENTCPSSREKEYYYFKFPRDDYKFEEVELHVTTTQVAESEDEDANHSALETLQ